MFTDRFHETLPGFLANGEHFHGFFVMSPQPSYLEVKTV
jgi:hypothetical protein